jgi:hypothetical protein
MVNEGDYIYLDFGNSHFGRIPAKNIIRRVYSDGTFLTGIDPNPHSTRHSEKDILCVANESDPIYPDEKCFKKILSRSSE